VFGFFVVEKGEEKTIVGTAIYYYRYSTWKGKRLYLEDYIITEKERGKGAGKLLFERVLAKSLEDGCTGMMWQVLDWNEPAINFYKKYGASMEEEWINCNLQSEEIRELI
jgi:GNAT superfamily N-acetyltransferase